MTSFVTVDVSTGEVKVAASDSTELALEAKRDGYYFRDTGPSKKKAEDAVRDGLAKELEASASEKQSKLQDQVTDQLET